MQKQKTEIYECRLTLKLTGEDADRLCRKAGEAGVSVPELLEEFIGDLIDGRHTGGSDERECADAWFERRYSMQCDDDDFVRYVLMHEDGERLLKIRQYIKEDEPDLQDEEYREDWDGIRENVEAWRSELEEAYAGFLEWSGRKRTEGNLEEDMQRLEDWKESVERFKGRPVAQASEEEWL